MYMMFPLYVLGTIVVSSMLVKAFFVGLPSSSTFLLFFFFCYFFFLSFISPTTTLIRVYANDRMQRSERGRHNGKPFLAFTRVIYHQTVYVQIFFFVTSLSLSLSFSHSFFFFFFFFFSLPPSFFHRFLVTVGCVALLCVALLVNEKK